MLINIIRIILLLIFIISIFLIICMKPKYDINEYLVCSVGNIISQKFVRKRNDKHFGNAKNFISGFNQLPSSKRFFCITHKKIINYLLRKVSRRLHFCYRHEVPDQSRFFLLILFHDVFRPRYSLLFRKFF